MWNTGTNWTGSWIAFGIFTKEPLHSDAHPCSSAPKHEAATTQVFLQLTIGTTGSFQSKHMKPGVVEFISGNLI